MKVPYKKFLLNLLKVAALIVAIALVGKVLPTFAGTVLCLLLLIGYYGAIGRCLKFCKINFLDALKKDWPRIFLAAIISTGFVIFVVSSQQTIYIWDSLETWDPTVECDETVFTDPHQALKDLRGSIDHADYNKFLPMLMALPMHLFGKSFLCYTLYVWIMFGLPAIFFAAATLRACLKNFGAKVLPVSSFMAILMLVPVFEVPVFIGYANVSILLPGAIIFAMLLSLDRAQLQIERLIWLGLLCVFAVFQARTAAYMIIGEFFGYAVYVVLLSLRQRTILRDGLLLCKKFFVVGISALLMTAPLFLTFIVRSVTYDIGTAYSAYQLGLSFPSRLIDHATFLGLAMYGIFLGGAVFGLRRKKFLPLAAFLLTWAIAAAVMFCRVQLLGWQHFYIMILPFALTIAALVAIICAEKKFFGAAIIFIMAFNFLQTFSPTLNLPTIFNKLYVLPVRHDIDDLKNFVAEMNRLTAGTDKKIYLLASSDLYNSSTLHAIQIPESHNALPNLFGTEDIDLRDGFPLQFFEADYVIVTEPIQTHLLPKDQSIVVKPAQWLTSPSPISRHFKLIKEYSFNADGSPVTFKVYEKISPLEQSDIDFAEKVFAELYPDRDDLFKNRFEQYKRQMLNS